MRTKTTLAAAAILAAGLASSMAQNVYSLNVVGYVNVTVQGGGAYNLIANPLNNTGGNNLTNLFSGPQAQSSQVLKWDPNTVDFSSPQPSYNTVGGWTANVPLNVGEGFFYVNEGTTFTQTFVGEVVQGSFSNEVAGNGSYNCLGASVPEGGSFTNAISGFTPTQSDQVLKWDYVAVDFAQPQPSFNSGPGTWTTTALTINPGEGFFLVNEGSAVTWVRNFTVQ